MNILNNSYEAAVAVETLYPHPRNPRKGDLDAIGASIQANGFYGAVIAQISTRFILAGNHRWLSAKKEGAAFVPVIWIDCDDERAVRILLADNRTNDVASYDNSALAELLKAIGQQPLGLAGSGYDSTDISELLETVAADQRAAEAKAAENAGQCDPDQTPETQATVVSAPGDIWILGRHRLLCGDSTMLSDVEKLMHGGKAEMIFTDPPYGVNFGKDNHNPRAKQWAPIANDELKGDGLRNFLAECFRNVICVSIEAAPMYCWAPAGAEGYQIFLALREAGIHVQSQLIWVKNAMNLGQADYQWRHEPCWYGWTPGTNHFWAGGRALTTVWEHKKDANNSYVHPTQKPVSLSEFALANSCPPGGIVLDLFGGSGSTLIGCEKTGAVARLMELEPKYCDVICRRYAAFTGIEPFLSEDGSRFCDVAGGR